MAPYPYDPAKAKQLLADAGYPNGFDIELAGAQGAQLKGVELMQELQKQLLAVGVKVKLNVMESSAFATAATKPVDENQMQIMLNGWVPSTGEARWTLFTTLHTDQWVPTGQNRGFYSNKQLDDLINSATKSVDQQQRNDLLKQAQQLAHDDACWVFLVAVKGIAARSAKLHNPFLSAFEVISADEKSWLEA